jgi:glycosyltransferase involved in cell wall biosynthesis
LKIAHITSVVDGRSNSGTARVARELIKSLSKKSEIYQTLIHFDSSDDIIYKLPRANEILLPLVNVFFAKRFFTFLRFAIICRFAVRKGKIERFDICHWHVSRIYPFFWLLPSKKFVLTIHDAGGYILPNVNTLSTLIFKLNIRLSLGHIDSILAVSEDAKRNLVKYARIPPEKISIVYPGSTFSEITARKPEHLDLLPHGFFLCVSRWQEHKNVSSLILGYSAALKANPELPKLLLVGKPVGDYSLPFRLMQGEGLASRILVMSDLKDDELAYLYDNAMLNIFPSLHEGFGLSVLEAMTRSCPSIVHKYTATAEIAGSSGILIDMTKVDEISKTLLYVVEHPQNIESLRKIAKKNSNSYTWSSTVNRTMEIYGKLLEVK